VKALVGGAASAQPADGEGTEATAPPESTPPDGDTTADAEPPGPVESNVHEQPVAAPRDPLASVPLDDGQPWTADAATKSAVAKMVQMLRLHAGDSTRATTAKLGEELGKMHAALESACTMTGKGREAFRAYLAVLGPRMRAMSEAETAPTAGSRARSQVSLVLGRFAEFFR
jgi:hypothetical protein